MGPQRPELTQPITTQGASARALDTGNRLFAPHEDEGYVAIGVLSTQGTRRSVGWRPKFDRRAYPRPSAKPMPRRPVIAIVVFAAGFAAAVGASAPAQGARQITSSDRALQNDVLHLVNEVRASHRLPRLRRQPQLARGASAHSAAQLAASRPSHGGVDGTPFIARVRRYSRARTTGETIAWIPSEHRADTIVYMWLASPAHRRVLLDRRFRRLGVGSQSAVLDGYAMTVVTATFASAR